MSQHQDNTNRLLSEEVQAKAVVSLLEEGTQHLNMQTLTRLEESRARAVSLHANQLAGHQVNHNGTLTHWWSWSSHPRMLGVGLLSVALLVGLTINSIMTNQNESSDAFLLAAELPPEAFVDKGFEPWLNAKVEM